MCIRDSDKGAVRSLQREVAHEHGLGPVSYTHLDVYKRQTPHAAENDIEAWDSTVLSSSFTSKAPKKTYLLHNDVTGQTIVIDKSTLLGRKPSMDVPQGAKAVRIVDPTRTRCV